MQFSDLERQYEEILESSRRRGEIASTSNDKRRHPRLSIDASNMLIDTIPEFSILDMSLSGMAFLSNHPLGEGEIIQVTLGSALSIDAQILTCRLEEAPSEFLDAQFRINAEFMEDTRGMELIVSLKGKPS